MAKVQTKDVVGLDQTLGEKLDTVDILEPDGIIKTEKVPEVYSTDALVDTGTLDPTTGLPFYQLNPANPLIASKVTGTDILNDQGDIKPSIIPETYSTDVLLDTGTLDPISGLPFYSLNPNQPIISSILSRLSQLELQTTSTPVITSSSTLNNDTATWSQNNAFDGNAGTAFFSDSLTGRLEFLEMDARTTKTSSSVKIIPKQYDHYRLENVRIEGSNDNNTWTTLKTFTLAEANATEWLNGIPPTTQNYTIPNSSYRYWRLSKNDSNLAIAEVQFYV